MTTERNLEAENVKHSIPGQDPYVFYDEDTGIYSLLQEVPGESYLTIKRSADYNTLFEAEEERIDIGQINPDCCSLLWAPEMHKIDGKLYIPYAASPKDNRDHRTYVLEGKEIVDGKIEWLDKGKVTDPENDYWAIDMTYFEMNEKLYAVWSGWESLEQPNGDFPQNLYIAEMEDPWTIKRGSRTMISKPEHDWEGEINEGPAIIKDDQGKIHIVYSANFSGLMDYTQGLLTLEGEDPLDPKSWSKHKEPIFRKNMGHVSFTKDRDTGEDLMWYHYKTSDISGWSDRYIAYVKWVWKDVVPVLAQEN